MVRLLCCTLGALLVLLSQLTAAFILPCPPSTAHSLKHNSFFERCATTVRKSEENGSSEDVDTGTIDEGPAVKGSPCEGFPNCDGEYRDKGCDGSGRIAGGVGAVLPWFPVKAFRPCPSFVAAKYKYDRSGQSLNEVMFARKRTRKGERKAGGDSFDDDDDDVDDDMQ